MTWLLRLYPRAWRRRYGDEVAAMLAGRPFSLALAIDLAAGAVDVWLHPAQTLAAVQPGVEDQEMIKRLGFYGAMTVMMIVTVGISAVWMRVHLQRGDSPIADAITILPFLAGMAVSGRFTFEKERAALRRATITAGITCAITVIWIGLGLRATGL